MRFALPFTFYFLTLLKLANSQTIEWKNEIKCGEYTNNYLAGASEDYYFIFKDSTIERRVLSILEYHQVVRELLVYDKDFNFLYKKGIYSPANDTTSDILYLNNKFYQLITYYNSEQKTNIADIILFDQNKTITTLKNVDIIDNCKNKKCGYFFFFSSYDRKDIIIGHKIDKTDKDDLALYSFKVFDSSLNLISENQFSFNVKYDNCHLASFIVDQSKNLHALFQINSGNRLDSDISEQKYELWSYYTKDSSQQKYNINLGKSHISGISLQLDTIRNQLLVGGYYSDVSKHCKKGVVYVSIDIQNKKILASNKSEIDPEVIEPLPNESNYKIKDEMTNVHYDYCYLRKDGGLFLISEYRHSIQYNYICRNIMINAIDTSGNLEWTKVIEKKQMIKSSFISSYSYSAHEVNGELILFYQIGEKYLKNKNGNYNPLKSAFILLKIDNNGNITKEEPIFRDALNGFEVIPKRTKEYNNKIYVKTVLDTNYKKKDGTVVNRNRESYLKYGVIEK